MKHDTRYREKYSVGSLLYSSASNGKVADTVFNHKYGLQYSLVLCLEETIADDSIKISEQRLKTTLGKLFSDIEKKAVLFAWNLYKDKIL